LLPEVESVLLQVYSSCSMPKQTTRKMTIHPLLQQRMKRNQ